MLSRHRSVALSLVFILLASSLWPVGVMAQETNVTIDPELFGGTEGNKTVVVDTTPLCQITGINVTSLDYEQAVAIQGIVTQDVAMSAERYRTDEAIRKLGLIGSQKTESQKRLEKYNLFFHGPDGMVFYAPKLGDEMRHDNAFLIGTSINGRVEYGAMMGEDLPLCPELPIDETGAGICTKRVGEKTDDFNIKPGGYTVGFINQTAETVGSSWISLINSLSLQDSEEDSWGYVALGSSRMKAAKWTTTMAVFPAGGATFIIPRTYMYFNARMKKLAWFDGATQTIFMAYAFGSLIKPLTKTLFKSDTLLMRTTSEAADAVRATGITKSTELFHLSKGLDNSDVLVNNILKTTNPKKLVKLLDDIPEARKILRASNNEAANKIARLLEKKNSRVFKKLMNNLDDLNTQTVGGARHRLTVMGLSPSEVDSIFPLSKDAKIAAIELARDNTFTGRQLLDSRNIVSIDTLVQKSDGAALTRYMRNNKVITFKSQKAFDGFMIDQMTPLSKFKNTKASQDGLLEIAYKAGKAEGPASREMVSALTDYKSIVDPTDPSNKLVIDIIREGYNPTPIKKLTRAERVYRTQKTFWSGAYIGPSGIIGKNIKSPTLLAIARLPQKALTSIVHSLYFFARPITLVAYGLHLIGLLAEKEGFLTLASPGLSLHWDPTETGPLFTPKSFIILLGVPSNIEAFYQAGSGGYMVGKHVRGFLTQLGMEPTTATKYSELGQNLLFGGVMYDTTPKLIEVQEENPKGTTKIDQTDKGYLMRTTNWENHAMVMVEDPASMRILQDVAVTALGMRTSNIDMYKHAFGQPNAVKSVFPMTWGASEAFRNWGTQSHLIGIGSVVYLWPSIPIARYAIAPLLIGIVGAGVFGAGETLLTSKMTSMQDLEKCYTESNYTGGGINCLERPPCEAVEARCEAGIGMMSMWLGVSGIVQAITERSVAFSSLNLALGIVDYVVLAGPGDIKGKIELTTECMADLLTCNERSFLVISGSQYQDPSIIQAEEERAKELKNLPGLDALNLDAFLEGFELGNNDTMLNPAQMQLNIHSEMDDATGRILFKKIYYVHLKDAKIDWLRSDLKMHFCPVDGSGDVIDELCITIDKDTIYVGDRPVVTDELVPFRWLDEHLPALIIPNTAIKININETTDCSIFISGPTGKDVQFNPSIVSTFEREHFEEVGRMMGSLRDIETDSGAIYPNIDYNGDYRWERDVPDGSFEYSIKDVSVTAKAKVDFENQTFGFKSAIFDGGVVIKKGGFIYILPKYFKPPMNGSDWFRATQGKPFVSDSGQALEVLNDQGQLIGINGSLTRIPGGDKLGIITKLDAWTDYDGDNEIDANETSGWRFYTKDNETYFDLWYDGTNETYKGSQIEIDEETGDIRIYKEDEPHIEANLLRSISTRVDEMGRSLLTIKDGKGNTLLEDALITWITGTGGSIRYDKDNNNYVFVNGQPIQLNNEFKTHGFNAVTGRPEPPLLQPSAISGGIPNYDPNKHDPSGIKVPIRPEGWTFFMYLFVLAGGIYLARAHIKKKKRETP